MSLNDELRGLADQFNKIVGQLPKAAEAVTMRAVSPIVTQQSRPTPESLLRALGESLTLEQQLWISRTENQAKIEPFLRSVQGRELVGLMILKLRDF